jgi:tellurite resistance protein TehA-like permease
MSFQKTGIIVFALYFVQCFIGALIHYVKPKNSTRRPPQNYFHAVFGLAIIALAMYQIRTGYRTEWPNYTGLGSIPNSVNILWMVWVVVRLSLCPSARR